MAAPLLTTKLFVPTPRPSLIYRPHLVQRLDDALQQGQPLTLVSAPAGYGKTTLASAWLQSSGHACAWVSLDEGDNDPATFLSYCIAALQRLDPQIGQSIQAVLEAPELAPMDTLMIHLINDLCAAETPVILVLDDYHSIREPDIHRGMRTLIERHPPQMHLVVLSRTDPPLPLPRLRAADEMCEIRGDDLRFSEEETHAFYEQCMDLTLSGEAVTLLLERAEGWIAGLRLAGLSLQGQQNAETAVRTFRGDDRYVLDYLADEVFARQPDSVQDFLLRTSVLERYNASLCDALYSEGGACAVSSREILAHLEAANLFIVSLDNQRAWYRYHHLFSQWLRNRLQRERPETVAELHRRASRWHEEEGNVQEAIDHALVIPDHGLAADLAEQHMMSLARQGRLRTCLRWMERIPRDEIHARPYLCAACGWVHRATLKIAEAESYLTAGEAALTDYPGLHVASEGHFVGPDEIRGELNALRGHCALQRRELDEALRLTDLSLECLPPNALAARSLAALTTGHVHFRLLSYCQADAAMSQAHELALASRQAVSVAMPALAGRGTIARNQGRLDEALRLCRQSTSLGCQESGSHLPGVWSSYWELFYIHYIRNELEEAGSYLNRGVEAATLANMGGAVLCCQVHLAQLAWRRGDLTSAERIFSRVDSILRSGVERHPWGFGAWSLARGLFCLVKGDLDAALRFAEELGLPSADEIVAAKDLSIVAPRWNSFLFLSRVFIAQGRYDASDVLTDVFAALAEQWGSHHLRVVAPLHRALARQGSGQDEEALCSLERALDVAAPAGFLASFVESGAPMARLLRLAMVKSTHPAFVRKLLEAIQAEAGNFIGTGTPPGHQTTPAQSLPEPLTERELQVLRLLAVGLTGREVAERLIISFHTARHYIRMIYGKLDVHSREEAIEQAEGLGLL